MTGAASFENGQFRVGGVTAEPARNRLAAGDQEIAVEPKIMDLLAELAREPGAVRARAELIDRVWGISYGGDESLTRAVSGLRRVLAQLAPGETFLETVPKRGYRLVAPVTVEAETGTSPLSPSPQSTSAFRLFLRAPAFRIAAAVAAILFCVIAVIAFRTIAMPPVRLDRVAVTKIEPVAADAVSAAEAKALRDNLLRELTLGGVETTSDPAKDGARLRLVGAIAPRGDAVMFKIEDAPTRQILWSRQFELTDDPDREIRHFIPWYVAGVVSCGLVGNDFDRPLTDPKLVGYFIRGCDGYRSGDGFEPLFQEAGRAVAYAPDNIIPKVKYAIAAAWAASEERSDAERDRLIGLARRTANDVIKAQPKIGQAYYARGVANWVAMDWLGAEQDLRMALALDPHFPFTYNALSSVLRRVGRTREALDLKQRAVVADHFSFAQLATTAIMLADDNHLSGAYAKINVINAIDEQAACVHKFSIDQWWGDKRAALASLDKTCLSRQLTPTQIACSRAFLKARLGEGDKETALQLCVKDGPFDAVRYEVAFGDLDGAVDLAMTRPINVYDTPFLFYSAMKPLQRDPRFMKIAARYGLTETWLQTNQWPDFCTDPDLPYDCRQAAEEAQQISMLNN